MKDPGDFAGLKIRVPPAALWTSMFKGFGASPTTINFNEVYSALQTHVVDGQENPLAMIDASKLYEVQKYCSMTNHMWDGFWLLANPRAYNKLPADIREVVDREFARATEEEHADLVKLGTELRTALPAKGMVFNDVDPAPFRDDAAQGGLLFRMEDEVRRPGLVDAGERRGPAVVTRRAPPRTGSGAR